MKPPILIVEAFVFMVMWSEMVLFSSNKGMLFGMPNERVTSSAEEQLVSI